MAETTPSQEPIPPKDQWLPLACPTCNRSAYDMNFAVAGRARSVSPSMFRKTDEKAGDLGLDMILACPYCGLPLAKAEVYPKQGGGWEMRFTWLAIAAKTI